MVDVVGVPFSDLVIADLEGHHPSFTLAVEIWHANVALNECVMNVGLVINLLDFVHVVVKYENMFVTHDE